MSIVLKPLDAAVEFLRRKTPVTSPLRTDGWDQVALGLRTRAQFSAAVESARMITFIQDRLDQVLSQARTDAGTLRDRGEFVRDLMSMARDEGVEGPGAVGTIADIASESRADLIYRTQTEQAYGYANWQAGQDADALDAAPAQELVRFEERKEKRNWIERWRGAGGRVFAGAGLDGRGRLVALKTDPVWSAISRFGTPFPPFDFNSGVGVRDVLRPEAEEIGLIQVGAPPPAPVVADFNQSLEVDVQSLGDSGVQSLQESFGDQVRIVGGKVEWVGNIVQDFVKSATQGQALNPLRLGSVAKAAADKAAATEIEIDEHQVVIEPQTVRELAKSENPPAAIDYEFATHVVRDPDDAALGPGGQVLLSKLLATKRVVVALKRGDGKRARIVSITKS